MAFCTECGGRYDTHCHDLGSDELPLVSRPIQNSARALMTQVIQVQARPALQPHLFAVEQDILQFNVTMHNRAGVEIVQLQPR
jgi:hypothetical protein